MHSLDLGVIKPYCPPIEKYPSASSIASIGVSTQTGASPPTSTGQDLVVSSSEPLATDTSLSNPVSLPSSGADDLNADPGIPTPQVPPTKLVSKRALWGWLKHTEIKTSP
ncbi:uncharacterized protein Bfra_010336 [Botrytis fragariae]|uniref:Uncharacterized protein n=1 Tax=Botrytis fragariae TaxID=1964551 RepID=A0A8H6AMA1_9HELO|nr:uncharacterized protein Bfra_010336 [Botrytis fragariae]KAF5870191.1 hypothetical protein Bfra_010336 [Botrytis fragariae]